MSIREPLALETLVVPYSSSRQLWVQEGQTPTGEEPSPSPESQPEGWSSHRTRFQSVGRWGGGGSEGTRRTRPKNSWSPGTWQISQIAAQSQKNWLRYDNNYVILFDSEGPTHLSKKFQFGAPQTNSHNWGSAHVPSGPSGWHSLSSSGFCFMALNPLFLH